MKKRGIFLFIMALCIMLALAGCSDSSTDSEPTPTVSGIASTGAAISGTVTLRDLNGEELGPEDIGPDGSFSFDVTGLTPPFIVRATSGEESWYSYAADSGTGNVNPLTTLVLAAAAGVSDPADVFADPAEVSGEALASALGDVQALFATLFAEFGVDVDFDPFTGDCMVDHDGFDAFLDALDITITAGGSVTVEPKVAALGPILSTTTTGLSGATPVSASAAADVASPVLWGPYNYCELFLDTPYGGSGATASAGTVTIRADGTFSSTTAASSSADEVGETGSGTYTLDEYGIFSISDTEAGLVTPDGEMVVILDVIAAEGLDVGLTILCRRDATLTAADLNGEYVLVELYRDTPVAGSGASAGFGSITLNGDGTYSLGAQTGTYAVDGNGRFTVDGSLDYGMIAKGGDLIVLPDYDPVEGEDVGMSLLVRTSTAAPWSVESVTGNYFLAEMYADVSVTEDSPESAVNSAIAVLDFENLAGAGYYTVNILCSSAGETGGSSGSYTSLTGYDGHTFNCLQADGSDVMVFTPDGELFVLPDDDPVEGGDVGMSLGIKTWREIDVH